jgi:hypothetical protein
MQYTLDLSQRWNGGRASYRKPGHTIRVAEYDVAAIPDDSTARSFILEHQHAGTSAPNRTLPPWRTGRRRCVLPPVL